MFFIKSIILTIIFLSIWGYFRYLNKKADKSMDEAFCNYWDAIMKEVNRRYDEKYKKQS